MRLQHLREAIAWLPAHLSGWTDTNVEGLHWDGVSVMADYDDWQEVELREQLKEAQDDAEKLTQENCELREEANKHEAECEKLREEMAALKDPTAEGESVATYRERAITAEQDEQKASEYERRARYLLQEMERELTLLRKKRGTEPCFIRHEHDILQVLRGVSQQRGNNWQVEAARVLARVAEDRKRQTEALKPRALSASEVL